MKTATAERPETPVLAITKRPETSLPIFIATGASTIALRAGASFAVNGLTVGGNDEMTVIVEGTLEPGRDYAIVLVGPELHAVRNDGDLASVLGGFHFALGGNATARAGGDDVPAINPCSIWDIGFRPGCADPRGMAYVAGVPGSEGVAPFWADIYLLNVDHLAKGTSAAGVEIADGSKRKPKTAAGKPVAKLDYATAAAIMTGHGKSLFSTAEFAAAAYGVTERTAASDKPKVAGLDAIRTSRVGLMQATGNVSIWGHDGDPDEPGASLFGGRWDNGGWAGSRYARVENWPDLSDGWIGARGRANHLTT